MSDHKSLTSVDDKLIKEDADEAFAFIEENTDLNLLNDKDYKSLLQKLDLRILTLMCLIYLLQFLDKSLLNYSAVMGIKENLKGNEFSNLGTIFYASYIFAEPFISYLFQKLPTARFLGFCICLWGIILACHSLCHTYAAFMVVRSLLGMFESCSAILLIAISGMFYTKDEQVKRMGFWSIQTATSTIIGGLLSFGFQHIHSKTFLSWQILFLFMGIITFFFGIIVFFYLPNNVTSARFLTRQEKLMVLEHIRINQTGTENKKFKKQQLVELLFHDKLTWPMFFLTLISMIVTGVLGNFSTTITATFGFTNEVNALLQLPTAGVVYITIVASTQLCAHLGHRTLITASLFVPTVVGCIIFLCLSPLKHKVANLIALYLLNSGSCVITMIYAWNSANTAGYTKRVGRNALTMIAFSVGCLIGPQLFRAHDAPNYTSAKITLLVTQAFCIPLTLLVGYLSQKENLKKSNLDQAYLPNFEFMDLTDIENKKFRYSY